MSNISSKKVQPLSVGEIKILISLVRSVKSDFASSEVVGISVPDKEQKQISKLESRLELQLACLSS